MKEIIFGLGTNLGDRHKNLADAVAKLAAAGFTLVTKSDIFETAPWGGVEQPDFLNMCVKMNFEDEIFNDPLEILKTIKKIELEMGRKKSARWGARLIDIDILLIGDLIYESEELTIPHKEMKNRDFVMRPLAQICTASPET